jgi:hypothetical protein
MRRDRPGGLVVRVKKVRVSPEVLFDFFKEGSHPGYWVKIGIPADAIFAGACHDPASHLFEIFITHPSFDDIKIAGEIKDRFNSVPNITIHARHDYTTIV